MSSRLDQLLEFRKHHPNDSFILFALAKEYEKLEQFEKALQHYLELNAKDAKYVGTYYHLGKLYERFGQPQNAFDTYTTGIAVARQQQDGLSLRELSAARLALGEEDDFE